MGDFQHSYNYEDKEDLTYIDRVNTTKLFGIAKKATKPSESNKEVKLTTTTVWIFIRVQFKCPS